MLLIECRRERKAERTHLRLVRRGEVGRALRNAVEVSLSYIGFDDKCIEIRIKQFAIRANTKDVVLVQTLGNLPLPDRAAAELVDVAALGHQHVADLQAIVLDLVHTHANRLDGREIEVAVLNVSDSQIG